MMFAKWRYLNLMPCPLCGMRLGFGFACVRHMLIWHPDIGEKGKAFWLPTVVEARKKWLKGLAAWKQTQRPSIRDIAHGLFLCSWLGHIDAHRTGDPETTTRCCKCFRLLQK